MVLLAMGIFGIAIATNSIITIKNCWKYYPNIKGIVYGFNVGAAGISTTLFNPLADFGIINSKKEGANKETGLYPKHVADRLPIYLYCLVAIFFVFGLTSYLCTFNYEDCLDEEKTGNEDKKEVTKLMEEDEDKREKTDKLIEEKQKDEQANNDEKKEDELKDDKNEEEKNKEQSKNEDKNENELKAEKKEEEDKVNKKRRNVTSKELFRLFFSKKNFQMLVFCIGGPCK